MVEYYHGSLQQVYSIVSTEIPGIKSNLALLMFLKAINNLVGFNGLVPILLVFGAYSKIIELDASFLSITQCAIAMKKSMDEVRKCTASQQVNDALNTCNKLSTTFAHDLLINLPVLVYQEGNVGQSGK